jgi:hypothetical protein
MKCLILFDYFFKGVSNLWDMKQVFQESVADRCKNIVTVVSLESLNE